MGTGLSPSTLGAEGRGQVGAYGWAPATPTGQAGSGAACPRRTPISQAWTPRRSGQTPARFHFPLLCKEPPPPSRHSPQHACTHLWHTDVYTHMYTGLCPTARHQKRPVTSELGPCGGSWCQGHQHPAQTRLLQGAGSITRSDAPTTAAPAPFRAAAPEAAKALGKPHSSPVPGTEASSISPRDLCLILCKSAA